ncbi:MAG TPA: ABC transporter permease [Thermoanaerobaculia bacterium]|nr:ABC transporter permease [Thermoanaerobaculia bacterium]
MRFSGAFRQRVAEAWIEIRENLGRSALQGLGIMVGVASVLGGFAISDSSQRRSDERWRKLGGIERLNVQPAAVASDGNPTALQRANLGLRNADAVDGEGMNKKAVHATSVQRFARARVRSPYADQERSVSGIGGDFLPLNGYDVEEGRAFSSTELAAGAPVCLLGAEAASAFFPSGGAVGQTVRVGDVPVVVVGVLRELVFRWRDGEPNAMAWRNRIVAVPAALVASRMNGDRYERVDRVTFKIPELSLMEGFSRVLASLLKANHRQQDDVRIDDIAARIRKRESQGQVYNMIFMLAGILSLIGGGMVNVNIQLASLGERVREVGVRMAIGASGREVFKSFMTEALLLTGLGSLVGLLLGIAFSKGICVFLDIPLFLAPGSFAAAFSVATAFGFLFALYPAWKASRLSPMEALRYE